jgi:MoaA/NifB/PqqE/SkfB family radical SAM enzyme
MTEFAQIEPTTRCNFTCGFCAGRSMRQGDLGWDTFERFLAVNPDLKYVELQGEGEPLMHPRFFDMVAACRARGIRVSLITNGSMFTREKVDRLIEEAVGSVHISLESPDEDEFRAIRGGKFSKVVEGIRLLIQRRRDLGKEQPTVGFSVTVLRRTLGAIPDIVALYNELELDGGIGVQPLQDMSCYTQHYDREMLEQLLPENLWRRYSRVFETSVRAVPVRVDAGSYYGSLFADFDPSSRRCPWLEHGAYLNIDGAVAGCCFIKNPHHVFGNVMTDRPEVIADRRRSLAEMLLQGVVPAPCSGCGVARAVTRTMHAQARLPVVSS